MDTNQFNGAFFLTITGVITAFISGALVYAIKSKCSRCRLCYGLIDIERNVELEEKFEEAELKNGINPFKNGEEKA
jgi:hypothetical protein